MSSHCEEVSNFLQILFRLILRVGKCWCNIRVIVVVCDECSFPHDRLGARERIEVMLRVHGMVEVIGYPIHRYGILSIFSAVKGRMHALDQRSLFTVLNHLDIF